MLSSTPQFLLFQGDSAVTAKDIQHVIDYVHKNVNEPLDKVKSVLKVKCKDILASISKQRDLLTKLLELVDKKQLLKSSHGYIRRKLALDMIFKRSVEVNNNSSSLLRKLQQVLQYNSILTNTKSVLSLFNFFATLFYRCTNFLQQRSCIKLNQMREQRI